MAGHSKWANIKHRKAAQDAKRGKIFTKIIRELTVAARQGGGNPDDNPRLRAVIDKALTANMKKDTIERAVERGAGGGDDDNYEELTYEGYGPGGVAIFVEVMTDNKNRSVAEIRHAFNKMGGNLGTDGSVAYLFSKQGIISYGPEWEEDRLVEAVLSAIENVTILSACRRAPCIRKSLRRAVHANGGVGAALVGVHFAGDKALVQQ